MPRSGVAPLPESGPCSVLLAPVPAEHGGSLSGRAGEDRNSQQANAGPLPPASLGRGVAGRWLAVLEGGSGPALGLQKALHEGQVVWVPPRVLGGTCSAHSWALGGLHLLSREGAFLRRPGAD